MPKKTYRTKILVTGSADEVRQILAGWLLSFNKERQKSFALRRLTVNEIRKLRKLLAGKAYVIRFVPKSW